MAHLRGRARSQYVARMFGRIARRYDLLNAVMSAGRHHAWRRQAVDLAIGDLRGPALDVAAGTGDFAFELLLRPPVSHVVGLDYTPEMLARARQKAHRRGVGERLTLIRGDAHDLPFADGQFVAATVGFGIRNFVDLPRALREMARVVQPGGRVATLEIVKIEGDRRWAAAFARYFGHVTPWLGALLAGDREAYTYLPESVAGFLEAGQIAAMMREAGLRNVLYRTLAMGTVAIHVGEKALD